MSALLGAETRYLMQKTARQERQPIEAVVAALMAALAFADVYLALGFQLRYTSLSTAILVGPGVFAVLCVLLSFFTVRQYKWGRPTRGLILIVIAMAGGTVAGCIIGDRSWWAYMVSYYNYQDMASYVNVDPGVDEGQSFMDAGTIYFKENSYVLKQKALAFHNGATYCVAPIVRQPVQLKPGQTSPSVLQTVTGFSPPQSGTLDFWAVGRDCCGTSGTDEAFTCGSAGSKLARSGMRVLSNEHRAMYLLAVQEWSASTGLQVRHPLFFTWVKDPIQDQATYFSKAWEDFWINTMLVFLVALVLGFVIQLLLMRLKIRGR